MNKTPTTTAATRMERSESGLHFLILRLGENSRGKEQALDQKRIIRECADITPVMTAKIGEEECMMKLLKTGNTKGVQDPGVNPLGIFCLDLFPFESEPDLGSDSGFCCVLFLVRWIFKARNRRYPALKVWGMQYLLRSWNRRRRNLQLPDPVA